MILILVFIYLVFRYLLFRDMFKDIKYCDDLGAPHKWVKYKNSLNKEALKCENCPRVIGEK